ncbi:protein PRRC2A-like [Mus musculus]|uniref:protein PRRC2A-like n=1 Tax=Mus musculus TaxID=10090 RepID=UPI0016720932|nr:protein PRRC2A-like [Mus musculus]
MMALSAAVRLEQPRSCSWRHFEAERRRNGLDWLRKGRGGGRRRLDAAAAAAAARAADPRDRRSARSVGAGRPEVGATRRGVRAWSRRPLSLACPGVPAGLRWGRGRGGRGPRLAPARSDLCGGRGRAPPPPLSSPWREAPRAASPFRLPAGPARGEARRTARESGKSREPAERARAREREREKEERVRESQRERERERERVLGRPRVQPHGGTDSVRCGLARPPLHRYSTDTLKVCGPGEALAAAALVLAALAAAVAVTPVNGSFHLQRGCYPPAENCFTKLVCMAGLQFRDLPVSASRVPGFKGMCWAGEMAQRLRAQTALPEVLHSIPSNHMVAHNHL